MLSAEDHPGIFYFLVGTIVLVFTGVGLSLLADQRFRFSHGVSTIQKDIATASDELGSLRAYHKERTHLLESRGTQMNNTALAFAEVRRKLESLVKRRSDLERNRGELLTAIPSVENEFSSYRANYRRQTWNDAIGQKLGTLTIRGGREYQDVSITRVTEVGLEIRHKDGIARIQAPDLNADWQDRFQWSDEERRKRLKEELADHVNIVPPPPVTEEKPFLTRPTPIADSPDAAKVQELRLKVTAWKAKVSRLRMEKSEAVSQAYGGGTSVTGSLETWKGKAARLTAEIVNAQAELVIAKSRLEAVAPNDTLLRTTEAGSETGY